ncbi:SpoIIE family protein phosphatase [Candidatus Viridilinea mediisalina]|uniref:Stage II sporulation protein E n=1 Tax=Candidatus Viridilinea mediisalina TaxID=2024553 RepID=A0A2A6RF96_9CHLR|nr:SpoIIE family protein phosphatase [Candidatus Viridilinea mediisalina]PDW01530.1 stage II sporulation protein E [Candidatus Viridilinea mediisalina]
MLEIEVAAAKIAYHGSGESGDTLEMIERPGGGFSFVLVDGQGTGRGAKTLSNLLATRAISLLKDGARDSAAARAVHDYLYTYRMGQVAATLNILSVDFQNGKIFMARNNPAPFFVIDHTGLRSYNEPSLPIGLQPMTNPNLTELAVRPYTYIVVFSDGLLRAGERYDEDLELVNFLSAWPTEAGHTAQTLTDTILERAIALDRGQPSDDMSILSLAILPRDQAISVRRMCASLPFEAPTWPAP